MIRTTMWMTRALALACLALSSLLHADPATISAAVKALTIYDGGADRSAFAKAELAVSEVSTEAEHRAATSALRDVLDSEAHLSSKRLAARLLSRIAGDAEVRIFAKLLDDADLKIEARTALERIPGAAAENALTGALAKAQGRDAAGLIKSLGVRGNREYVSLIAGYLSHADEAVVAKAIDSLGQLGGGHAARALQTATLPESLQDRRDHALLRIAEALGGEGNTAAAVNMLTTLETHSTSSVIQDSAFLQRMQMLEDPSLEIAHALRGQRRSVALQAISILEAPDALSMALEHLQEATPNEQTIILDAARRWKHPKALERAIDSMSSSDPLVRETALRVIGEMGDASSVDLLLHSAKDDRVRQLTLVLLARQTTEGVDERIAQLLDHEDARLRQLAAEVISMRGSSVGLPALLKRIETETDPQARKEAIKALGMTAGAGDVPALLDLIQTAPSAEHSAFAHALLNICTRNDAAVAATAAEAKEMDPEIKGLLFKVLARSYSGAAIPFVFDGLTHEDSGVRRSVAQGLGRWPQPTPLEALLDVVEGERNSQVQALMIDGIRFHNDRSSAEVQAKVKERYKRAMALGESH